MNDTFSGTGKVIILSAPSGAGKTTVMKHVVGRFPQLEFSVSATSRAPRAGEVNGADYYFMTPARFMENVRRGAFVEWEEVYGGTHYGTLRAEVEKIWSRGRTIVFDVDVVGGVNLKRIFGRQALSIFIMPPSVDALRARLAARGTDSSEAIERRVAKAATELEYAPRFDKVIVNDDLDEALRCAEEAIGKFLEE